MIYKPSTREEWLKLRRRGIGGSDAGAALGVNKWRSNIDLWREKTGITEHEDISDKPAVKFGKNAEEHIRALFTMEYPDIKVDYHEFDIYVNDSYPFLYATLDGELTDAEGRRGILEIKTSTLQNVAMSEEWKLGRIPQSYYVQILHQLAATGWDFVYLVGYLRLPTSGTDIARLTVRYIERSEVEEDIRYLIERETAFWQAVETKKQPPLLLPEI